MTILITGVAGFIGSHLADRLLGEGHSVVGIDNFDPFYPRGDKEENLRSACQHERFTLVEADIRRQEDLALLTADLEGCDAIAHLAAKAGVRPSLADPAGYHETNVVGTANVLELARELGVKQFVFASSSSVYGVNPNVPWSETDKVLLPISPYASTKVSAELMGHVYSHLYGIRFIALRFFTVYGPRQRPDLAICKFSRRILNGEAIDIFGDGSTRRDYTFVDDTVSGIVAALSYDRSPYEIINLGNDRTVPLRELLDLLERVLGRPAVRSPQPEQPGDVPQTWADISKARELLGYDPSVTIEEGVARFADWMKRGCPVTLGKSRKLARPHAFANE
jgi:UDP-glucuronate 4-epimerase